MEEAPTLDPSEVVVVGDDCNGGGCGGEDTRLWRWKTCSQASERGLLGRPAQWAGRW